jgi:hypothetical protein
MARYSNPGERRLAVLASLAPSSFVGLLMDHSSLGVMVDLEKGMDL